MMNAVMSPLLNLKVAKDRKGIAPNKPLLVLAILDLFEAGLIGLDGLVHKDAQLNLRFRSYSPICAPRRGNAIDLNLPFRHLASDRIYTHDGDEERVVRLDPVLLARFLDPRFRQEARRRIVATYFPRGRASGLIRRPGHANAVLGRAGRGPPRPGRIQGPA